MKLKRICAIALAVWSMSGVVDAHDGGHDEASKAAPDSTGVPRVEAHSDLFEIVGVVEHATMTLYLDRYADNEPVKDAKIEIETGKDKGIATPNPDGTYTFASKLFATPGQLPFTFTVIAGKDTDLLAGDLVIPDARAGQPHAVEPGLSRTALIMISFGVLIFALVAALVLCGYRLYKKAG